MVALLNIQLSPASSSIVICPWNLVTARRNPVEKPINHPYGSERGQQLFVFSPMKTGLTRFQSEAHLVHFFQAYFIEA
jgi:hypothetical protein